MRTPKTILVFQEPELYFFPHYNEIVFSPFGIPERSFRYLIYKAMYLLRLPCCSMFWGDWKKHLKNAEQVILFDYGYQRGMEQYIRKQNPSCKVVLFMWNRIDRVHYNHRLFSDKNAIYSTDRGDCARYHLKYQHIFYPMEYYHTPSPICKNRLFFIGQDKGRASLILKLRSVFLSCGITCDIRVLSHAKDPRYLESVQEILTDQPLTYREYCLELAHCDILLDINQKGQTALTMRVMEAIYHSKKLITNNQDIIHYDFYDENNIFLLPENEQLPSKKDLTDFLQKPFLPYSEEILHTYSFEHWASSFS